MISFSFLVYDDIPGLKDQCGLVSLSIGRKFIPKGSFDGCGY